MRQYNVTGMSCAACSSRVEKAVSSVSGVDDCAVNLLTGIMSVEGSASDTEIINAVVSAGFGATAKDGMSDNEKSETGKKRESQSEKASYIKTNRKNEISGIRKRLIASVVILVPLLYISMGYIMWDCPLPGFLAGKPLSIAVLQMLLSGLILVINQKFFINGFKGVVHKAPNMDTLVSLGSSVAFVYSIVVTFILLSASVFNSSVILFEYLDELYFDSAAMILTLITVGKLLEAKSKGKTTDAMLSLMELAPDTAVIIRDGKEIQVSVKDVMVGDHFVVKPGESIPVDGIVVDGVGAVNEAALTGESIPVDKKTGDEVQAATINQNGFLECEAIRIGEDTSISKIIRMATDATSTKAPVAKIADKVSAIFVPCVLVIAFITLAIWMIMGYNAGYALIRAVSVLVISCPCALGLATPVAIMVGNGKAAKNGILFKTASSLELTGKTKIAVLDKTGTLTSGEPVVKGMITADGCSEKELLEIALSLEKKSEHPFAKAIIKEGKIRNAYYYNANDFHAEAGNGVSAVVNGEYAFGGNLEFVRKNVEVNESMISLADEVASAGMTPLFFARGERILGIIAVADSIKPESADAVNELKNMGLYVVMLTGDNRNTAQLIAEEAGVDDYIADVKPEDKMRIIRELQEKATVVMVGDGINDAPALTQADIGMAIGAGTDVAIDAADVVLMKNSIKDVAVAIRMSRATLRNIHQNLFWAFIYNIICIPVAAGVLIPVFGLAISPAIGAAAMGLSSFCVVMNALRLNLVNPRNTRKYLHLNNSVREEFESEKENASDEKEPDIDKGNEVEKEPDSDKGNEVEKELDTDKGKEKDQMKTTVIVNGMMCPHCEARMKSEFEEIEGVVSASCSHENSVANIESTEIISEEVLKNAVEKAGYEYGGIK